MNPLNYHLRITSPSIALIGQAPQPQVPGYTHTNTGYQSVIVRGDYAYMIGSGGDSTGVIGLTLTIFNVEDPTNPYFISYITTGSVPWVSGPSYLNGAYKASLSLDGKHLYIASSGSSYLYVVDVSDPAVPFNLSRLLITNTPGSLYGIDISDSYAYLATQNKGLTVVNISNPSSPTQVFQEGGTTNKSIGVYLANGYCYTTNYQTTSPWTVRYLKIWSLTNPASPSLLTTYTLPAGTKPAEVTVQGNYASVGDLNTSTAQIIDVSNPLAPNYLSSLHASASFDVTNDAAFNNVTMYGNYAYLTSGENATYGGAIDFFDTTNKSSPVKLYTYEQGVPNSLFNAGVLYNNMLYVANYGVSPTYAGSLNIYSSQTAYSSYIPSQNLSAISAQISNITSAYTGSCILQGSDDLSNPVNWTDIASTVEAISGAGIYLIPHTEISYQFIRFSYTGVGSGDFDVSFKALGF